MTRIRHSYGSAAAAWETRWPATAGVTEIFARHIPDTSKDAPEAILRCAYELAARSPDRSNQNGAIIMSRYAPKQVWSVSGWNDFTPGVQPTAGQLADRDWKIAHITHAERAALSKLFFFGAEITAHPEAEIVMYCPWFACTNCANAIALSPISKIVGHKQRMDTTPERWKADVDMGLNIIAKAGIEMEFLDIPILGRTPSIRVNGEDWTP